MKLYVESSRFRDTAQAPRGTSRPCQAGPARCWGPSCGLRRGSFRCWPSFTSISTQSYLSFFLYVCMFVNICLSLHIDVDISNLPLSMYIHIQNSAFIYMHTSLNSCLYLNVEKRPPRSKVARTKNVRGLDVRIKSLIQIRSAHVFGHSFFVGLLGSWTQNPKGSREG